MSRGSGARSTPSSAEAQALAAFLRELANRAERDPVLAAHLRDALEASGLLAMAGHSRRPHASAKSPSAATPRPPHAATSPQASTASAMPDPYVLLRERGEEGLRAALAELDLAALRAMVRTHRLDPARIAARWTARERVIELIVSQVRGRANLGKAFARV
jgi:hypothetical protein